MIDWAKSAELNNSTTKELKAYFSRFPGSRKKVVDVCNICGKARALRFNDCVRGHASRCKACSKKGNTAFAGHTPHNKGKKTPLITRQKMSNTHKGRVVSDDTRKHISAGHQGVPYDTWEKYAREQKYCPKFNEACKESNREKYGRECFICGKTEKDNGQRLSVHHVDMDRAQGCESNWKLVPLCISCHAHAHNDEIIARLGYILANN